jgi:LIVCS family branched-chain amino acid:cation transporter
MVNGTGKISGITGVIGKIPSTILNTAVLICIGPLLVVPRSSATTYEMTIIPILPNFSPILFSIIFFGIVWALAIKKSKIVDIVGKFLTPAMVIALVVLIGAGIMAPLGPISEPTSTTVIKDGIIAGYQAMDVLGALTVAIVVISTLSQRGYAKGPERVKIATKACIVAGVMLFLVYGGLTFLGASVSKVFDIATVNQASLIVAITEGLLGYFGVVILGIIVGLACLTTSIGVSSAVAQYFESISNGKIEYKKALAVIVIFSTIVSNFGLSTIISFAAPVLSVVYPTIITLILLSFFKNKIKNINLYRGAALFAITISVLSVISSYGVNIKLISMLPLSEFGFEWILPTIIGGVIGNFIKTGVSNNSIDSKDVA